MAQSSNAAVLSGTRSTAGGTRSTLVRAAIAAALAALLVLLAAGCAIAGSPGTVAYVGDQQITQQQLDAALDGVQSTLEEGQQVSPEAVVNVMIQGRIADQIATQRGLTVTDAQRDAVLKQSNLAPMLEQPEAKQVAYDIANPQLVAQEVGTQNYLQDLQAMRVELNPRFGVLDPASKTIVEGQSSSLSLPASPS